MYSQTGRKAHVCPFLFGNGGPSTASARSRQSLADKGSGGTGYLAATGTACRFPMPLASMRPGRKSPEVPRDLKPLSLALLLGVSNLNPGYDKVTVSRYRAHVFCVSARICGFQPQSKIMDANLGSRWGEETQGGVVP
jgi:hypothetical protein